MSIQLRQCSTNHAYATLWLKDSYIIVLVVWKVDRCLTLYLERAFFRPCDLINQHALVHLMKIWTSMNVIHVGCPFTKKDSLGKWYWHWSIDPTWLILRKKINRVPSRFESAMTWGQRCSRPEKPTDPWRTTHCYLIDRRGHLKKRSLITWRSENSVKPVARRFAARVFSLVFTPSSLVWDTIVVNVVSYFTLPLVGSAVRGR